MNGYRKIALTQGKYALVDREDFERLNKFNWTAMWKPNPRTFYASRMVQREDGEWRHRYMHHEVLGVLPPVGVDHANRNGIDNRKHNLRQCTRSLNQANRRKQSNNTSGYKGVFWNTQQGQWAARVKVQGKQIHLGFFDRIREAARSYDKAAVKYFGNFASTNFQERRTKSDKTKGTCTSATVSAGNSCLSS